MNWKGYACGAGAIFVIGSAVFFGYAGQAGGEGDAGSAAAETEGSGDGRIVFIEDDGDQWTGVLLRDGELSADLDGDGKEDRIRISYAEREGARCIEEFEMSVSGRAEPFVLRDYDASFEKIEYFDLDGDGRDEWLLLFDTHGGGGEGTHDLFIVWPGPDERPAERIREEDLRSEIGEGWNADGIYNIEKARRGNETLLLTYRYVWGEEGHSDRVGDLVSVAAWDGEKEELAAEETWMEKRDGEG